MLVGRGRVIASWWYYTDLGSRQPQRVAQSSWTNTSSIACVNRLHSNLYSIRTCSVRARSNGLSLDHCYASHVSDTQ